ncbi:hypothetical protein ACOMHN_058988 [Nucella lapillus]
MPAKRKFGHTDSKYDAAGLSNQDLDWQLPFFTPSVNFQLCYRHQQQAGTTKSEATTTNTAPAFRFAQACSVRDKQSPSCLWMTTMLPDCTVSRELGPRPKALQVNTYIYESRTKVPVGGGEEGGQVSVWTTNGTEGNMRMLEGVTVAVVTDTNPARLNHHSRRTHFTAPSHFQTLRQ